MNNIVLLFLSNNFKSEEKFLIPRWPAHGKVVSSFGKKAIGKLVYFMSIDKARFRQLVTPGDQLFIEVRKKQARKLVWKFDCLAKVEDKIVAEAIITAMIADSND